MGKPYQRYRVVALVPKEDESVGDQITRLMNERENSTFHNLMPQPYGYALIFSHPDYEEDNDGEAKEA